MGSLLPPEGECPKSAQLYIYDTDNEVKNRVDVLNRSNKNDKLDDEMVSDLIQMLDQTNELVKIFRIARDKVKSDSIDCFRLRLFGKRNMQDRQYDLPTSSHIGGLIVGDIGDFKSERDIIIELRNGILRRITKLNPKYMALQYPLLFPYDEDGYRPNILWNKHFKGKKPKKQRIPMRAFIAYQIQDRFEEDDTLFKGGKLFQQFLVDAYATLEEDRLDFIRSNQNSLRSEVLKGIQDAVVNGDSNAEDLGKRVILPSSYTGSARYMINNYQDAMAICRCFGNPDLFITFTCNSKWPEILSDFGRRPGCKMEDKPDLVSRIFRVKLDDMIKYIKSRNPFGEIEAGDIDSIISAEIPDKEFDPNGYAAVSEFMMHDPCGLATQNSPCMEDDEESSWIKVPNDFLVHFDENPIESIVYSVYIDFEKIFDDSSYLRERAIVTPRNETVS
ncbi:hypothetical protein Q3G72_000934 [Acer saccharum]|nr:hypothetical protein Q3G72_000934 [Acer saccharum]